VYRLNLGVSKPAFAALLGESAAAGHDFTAIDQIMPHPIYGAMHWICVLSPSDETFGKLKLLLAEAYASAKKRYDKRT